MSAEFDTIEDLIADLRNGKMVLLVDDEDRENEGDLVLAADHVTPQTINFMATEARGLICLSLSAQQIERLQLPQMVGDDMNFSPNKTAFTVSIEASSGVSTGISAADRAHTVRVAANPQAKPSDVHRPGHIFPIRAQAGGVLKRAGHTEGSVDLARLAGLNPAAVICEVMNADGTMARVGDLRKFATKHKIRIGTIVDLIEYRLKNESLVEEVMTENLPEHFGTDTKVRVFRSKVDGQEHFVLQKGEIKKDQPALTRIQTDNPVRDFFHALHSGEMTAWEAWKSIDAAGSGLLVLLRGSHRLGLVPELKAMLGAEEGLAKATMDDRDYGIGAQILRACNVHQIRLLSNRPEKRVALKAFNLEIVEIVPFDSPTSKLQENNHETHQSGRGHKPLQ